MADYYNHIYCIHCDNLELIEQVLTRMLKQEGYRRIPLPPLSIDVKELRRDPLQLQHHLWIIGLFVGTTGWTIVKATPAEILCRRGRGAQCPRLLQLATEIGSGAFYLSVYSGFEILMEVDASSGIFVSGEHDSNRFAEDKFFDEQINSKETGRFFLLEMPVEEIQRIEIEIFEEGKKSYEHWEEQFLENYARHNLPQMTPSELEQWVARWKGMVMLKPENWQQLSRQEEWQQIFAEWGDRLQDLQTSQSDAPLFEQTLERLLGGTRSYWYLGRKPLIYRAYTEQQQLEADGARLLFFQPPEH